MPQHGPAEGFFLPTGVGQRYCLFHPVANGVPARGAFLHVHAFAEEQNKSRRMTALQARAFARAGYAVLQIDLYGCGDSSGDFGDARWEIWLDDLRAAHAWLAQRQAAPVDLWGTRLGALLALDYATNGSADTPVREVLLWQPVTSGEQYLTQFLRIRMATDMLVAEPDAGSPAPARTSTTQAMRASLAAGDSLEVAGYMLTPALATSIGAMKLGALGTPGMRVHWFEVVADAARPLPPAAATAAGALRTRGVDLQLHLTPGPQFWAAQEIVEAPALLAATLAFADGVPA